MSHRSLWNHLLFAFVFLIQIPAAEVADSGEKHNLILGVDYNVGVKELRIFLASLRSSGCHAKVILFSGSPLSNYKRELAERHMATFLEYDFGELNRTHGPVGVHRFHLYRKFLEAQKDKIDYVLHTDVRDVVFQDDPFTRIEAHGGGVFFLESDHLLIGTSPTNRGWMTENCTTYHREGMLERTRHRLRSCSGNMYGTAEAVFTYAQMMEEEQQRTADVLRDENGMVMSGGWCADQAVHQALLWTGKFASRMKNVSVYRNEDGPVCTMGDMPTIMVDEMGDVRNSRGELYAVVHQYDRHERVRDTLRARYNEEDAPEDIHPEFIEGYSPLVYVGDSSKISRHVGVDVSVHSDLDEDLLISKGHAGKNRDGGTPAQQDGDHAFEKQQAERQDGISNALRGIHGGDPQLNGVLVTDQACMSGTCADCTHRPKTAQKYVVSCENQVEKSNTQDVYARGENESNRFKWREENAVREPGHQVDHPSSLEHNTTENARINTDNTPEMSFEQMPDQEQASSVSYIVSEAPYVAMLADFMRGIPEYPEDQYAGRGVVMSAGGQLQVCVYVWISLCGFVRVYVCVLAVE
jgi:hypothetical protein